MARLLFALLVAVFLFAGCSGGEFVYIVVDDDCKPKDQSGNLLPDHIELKPGDIVVWRNNRSDDQTLTIENSVVFGNTTYIIPKDGGLALTLVQLGGEGTWEFSFTCTEGAVGGPRVKVDDDPEP